MEKAYAETNAGQSAVSHHPLESSGTHSNALGEFFEVRPPVKIRKERRTRHEPVEQEFFPLVSAAHEFKTPLVVMLGYTDLLRTGRLGAVNHTQHEVLGEIQESAERLKALIQDLLLLCELRSYRGAGASNPELPSVEVNEQVSEIFRVWAATAKQKSIAYELLLSPGNSQVRVEGLKLQHIVSNLIENALKYTPAQGLVVVQVTSCFWERRKAQTDFLFNLQRKVNHKPENAVRIEVSDTGPGIPSEHHEDIFLDFVQLRAGSRAGPAWGWQSRAASPRPMAAPSG
jgi:signal transduction histidine kinase